MGKTSKKLMCCLVASQFLMATIFYNTSVVVSANTNTKDQVNIRVSDSTGQKTDFRYSPDNPSYIAENDIVLKGDSYASFSMNSSKYNTMQYKVSRSITEDSLINDEEGWRDIKLDEQKINNDVMIENRGFLKHKPYNVNHLPVVTNQSDWNNRSKVYKNPYSGSSIISAARVRDAKNYGKMESYLENGEVQTRFVNNTIFLDNTTGKRVYYTDREMKHITSNQTNYSRSASEVYLGRNYKEASKMWGYLKVDETGKYNFKSFSDDGLYAYIIVNGVKKEIVDRSMFKVQGSTPFVYNGSLELDKDKYYPIYIEYFNWGGDASFEMNFKKSTEDSSKYRQIPSSNLYPSKSDYPGEYAESVFAGADGIKLPTEAGRYYIAYRAVNKDNSGNITKGDVQGILGTYLVEPRAKLNISKTILTPSGREVSPIGNKYELDLKNFKIKYKVTPLPISVEELIGDIRMSSDIDKVPEMYTMTISNPQLNVILPSGLGYANSSENSVVEGQKSYNNIDINNIQYRLDRVNKVYIPITTPVLFTHEIKSDNFGCYTLSEEYSKFMYKDVDGGNRELRFNTQNIILGAGTEIMYNELYNTATNKHQIINEKTILKTMIPNTFATKIKVNSLNPTVNIRSNGMDNHSFDLIKYEINSNGVIDKSTKEVKKTKRRAFSISSDDKFKLTINKEYLIVYQIRATRGAKLNILILNERGIEKYNKTILTQDPPILK